MIAFTALECLKPTKDMVDDNTDRISKKEKLTTVTKIPKLEPSVSVLARF